LTCSLAALLCKRLQTNGPEEIQPGVTALRGAVTQDGYPALAPNSEQLVAMGTTLQDWVDRSGSRLNLNCMFTM
jgi:hypothetical protein